MPPEIPPPNPRPEDPLKTIRTFQGDMEETIHRHNESLSSIALAEEKRKEEKAAEIVPSVQVPEATKKFSSNTPRLIVISLILIIVGAVGITAAYIYFRASSTPIAIKEPAQTIIQTSSQKSVSVHFGTLTNDMLASIQTNLKNNSNPGSIVSLNFMEGTTSLSINQFFSAFGPSAPSSLVRSVQNYASGILENTRGAEPFFVFSSSDFGTTYAGMLAWEPTLIPDVISFFPNISHVTFATSTLWTDDSFDNLDVRVARDNVGQIVLVYGFFDKSTWAITQSEPTFETLEHAYINAKLKR